MLRGELDRYDRQALLKQINHADLGRNRDALISFIAARQHLLDLHEGNWPEMASRYGKDPRFAQQTGQMEQFLRQTECDPNAPDFLNQGAQQRDGLFGRLISGVAELSELLPDQDTELADEIETADPDDFSAYTPKRSATAQNSPPALPKSGNAAFVLGLFTFLTAITVWIWMRYGIRQRRRKRYPCALPAVIFDGIVPVLGEVLDLSQLGAKIETNLTLKTRQKIRLTIDNVEIKCRVAWKNQHFVGVEFSKPISEHDIEHLLGPFADKVAAEREAMGDLAFCDQFDFPVHPALRGQEDPAPSDAQESDAAHEESDAPQAAVTSMPAPSLADPEPSADDPRPA